VINVGNDGAGTLTLSNTGTITLVGNLNVPNASGSGVINLDGGTLTVPKIAQNSGPGTFNFNGGTLKPTISRTDFLQGLATVNVKDNGARIDTVGFDITIAQLLQHGGVASTDGGLIKSSSGTLTLSGANTYNGANQVNGGKLVVTTAHTGGGSFTIADGAALGATVASAGASLITSSLILGGSTGATSEFNLGTGNPTAPVINATALETHGTVTVNVSGVGLSVGQFPLIKYTSSIAGSGFAAFSLGTLPSGVTASLLNNSGNPSVDLNITAAPKLVWTAATNSNWDVQTTTNWLDSLTSTATGYSDGLPVLFDDTAASGAV
jgi:autotransporter-associated beta strand protein